MSNKEDRISRMENMPETFLLENNQGRIQDDFPMGGQVKWTPLRWGSVGFGGLLQENLKYEVL